MALPSFAGRRQLAVASGLLLFLSVAFEAFAAITVSPVDSRYFADGDSGRTWIPVGCNICFDRNANDSAAARRLYEGWMASFATNGGNYLRVWLSAPFLDVMPDEAYRFSAEAEENLKWLVSRAEVHGLRLKFTLENFRRLGPKSDADPEKGVISFKSTVYAPFAKRMREVFTSEKCADIYLAKARRIAELVGRSDALVAVELWNEINSVSEADLNVLGAWSERMLAEMKKLFPGKMTLQNVGSFSEDSGFAIYDWLGQLKGNDFMQAHRYFDPGADLDVARGPMDVLCADAVRELLDRRPGLPAVLAETGCVERHHASYSHLYRLDTQGMMLHDEIFAAFFAGSAGSGEPWHWDHQYISQHGLWWHFARFAKAVEGLDPAAEHFRPFRTESSRLRFWGLRGNRTTVIWLRDKRNTLLTEVECGRRPEPVAGEAFRAACFRRSRYDWYLPWTDASLTMTDCKMPTFTRSAVVRFATQK